MVSLALLVAAAAALAAAHASPSPPPPALTTTMHLPNSPTVPCSRAGPQSPREIDGSTIAGTNGHASSSSSRPPPSFAGPAETLNLCNIHMHKNAEHKAQAFSKPAGSDNNHGWQCSQVDLTAAETAATAAPSVCGGLRPGDTVEVHWVYSSCNGGPGHTIKACMKDHPDGATGGPCAGDGWRTASYRVEAQVFVLVNGPGPQDGGGLDFATMTTVTTVASSNLHQVVLPDSSGGRVQYVGSSCNTQTTFPIRRM